MPSMVTLRGELRLRAPARLSLLAAMLQMPRPAAAEVVRYAFAGTITEIYLNENNVLGELSIGDPFAGVFEFDPAVPDSNPGDVVGNYSQHGGALSVSLPELSLDYAGFLGLVVVDSAPDRIFIGVDTQFDDFNVSDISLLLIDTTGSAFDSDQMPRLLELSWFDEPILRLIGDRISTSDSFGVQGVVTSLILVPAPNACVMGALLGGAYLWRRRRRTVQV